MELFRGLTFFHESGREFEDTGSFGSWEFLIVHSQDEYLGKLQAFRGVHGHQLHRVARRILFEADRSSRLFEIIEVFEELGEPARLTLGFPFLHKF